MTKITTPKTSRIRIQILLHVVHSTRTLPRKEQGRHSRGGPTIRETLTPNPKVGTRKYIYLCLKNRKVSANLSFLTIYHPLFFFILPLINIPNELIIMQKKQRLRVFYSIYSIKSQGYCSVR